MSESSATPPGTPAWIEKINVRDLGALTATVHRVQAVVGDERSSLQDLSRVLQNDPTLVSRVLSIANSPSYMATSEPVTTITRASSLIGFDAIRNICIANRLLDALLEERELSESVKERLLTRLAASLHAAIQARTLMRSAGKRECEEAFLSALLDQIGESAFWSVGGEDVNALDAALAEPGINPETVVRQQLGGSFKELSRALIRKWGLEDALTAGGDGYQHQGPSRTQAVQLSNEIADAAAQEGWQSARMKAIVPKVAELLQIETDEAWIRLRACGKQAEELASCYGANVLAKRMNHRPPPPEPVRRKAGVPPADEPTDATRSADTPNATVQLEVLRQMRALVGGQEMADINTVIRTAMDGVHRGIGMDRTLTALLSPDRKELQVRFWTGEGGEEWSKAFRFPVGAGRSVLNECVADLACIRFDARAPGGLSSRIPAQLMRFCTGQDFLLAPVTIGTRSIGVMYADRAHTTTPIGKAELAAFSHFSKQLGACLAELTRRKT